MSPAIRDYIRRLNQEFGQYAVGPDKTRRLMDECMGDISLTEFVLRERRRKT